MLRAVLHDAGKHRADENGLLCFQDSHNRGTSSASWPIITPTHAKTCVAVEWGESWLRLHIFPSSQAVSNTGRQDVHLRDAAALANGREVAAVADASNGRRPLRRRVPALVRLRLLPRLGILRRLPRECDD